MTKTRWFGKILDDLEDKAHKKSNRTLWQDRKTWKLRIQVLSDLILSYYIPVVRNFKGTTKHQETLIQQHSVTSQTAWLFISSTVETSSHKPGLSSHQLK